MISLLNWQIWFLIGAILLIAEMLSGTFVLLFIGLACIGSAIVAAIKLNFAIQCFTFCIICLITLLPFLNIKRSANKKEKTPKVANSERLIGKIGIITEEIPEFGAGSVKVDNETWMATSETQEGINVNEKVIIKKIAGVKLIVAKE